MIPNTYPVTLITGENGTGKSIIIDSLRMLFKGLWGIDRNIIADQHDFRMAMTLSVIPMFPTEEQLDEIVEFLKQNEE